MLKRDREDDGIRVDEKVRKVRRLPKHLQKKLRKERKKVGPCIEVTIPLHKEHNTTEYPYIVNDDDHCETPQSAYADIAPILDAILKEKRGEDSSRSELAIYDPYYCEGAMKAHLASLGFTNVYNKCEDFYKIIEERAVPQYDVLVTNPPYSGDHPKNLIKFIKQHSENKPFLLLMPNWVYTKDYFTMLNIETLFYVSPCARYLYTTPKGRRQKKSAKFTSPFPTFWYGGTGMSVNLKSSKFIDGLEKVLDSGTVHLSRTPSQLPLAVVHESDARKRKARDKLKRNKNKKRKKNSNVNACAYPQESN